MSSLVTGLLRRVPIFAELDERALEELAQKCQKRRFPSGEAVFHQGDPGVTLYILCSGRVNIQKVASSGETVHIAHRVAGEHFGEMALFDGKPRMADVVTAEPSEFLVLHRDAFIQCVEKSPKIALKVMSVLADRLREAAAHLENQQELDVMGRVCRALLQRMETNAVSEPGGGKRLNGKVTQQQLAEEIAATRESVNRTLADLKESKVIRMDGRTIIVMNETGLRQRATP